jgi:hypothetical protein
MRQEAHLLLPGYEILHGDERLGTPWPTLEAGLSTFVQSG